MGIASWIERTTSEVRNNGIEGAKEGLYELYAGAWRVFGWHIPRGTNIYERDWDLLIILDACRVDLLCEVAPAYDFIDNIESFRSVGSMSEEWMTKTFVSEYADDMRETAYITANVFSETVLNEDDFLHLDEVWRYGWDNKLGIVPPRPVTNRAISIGRNRNPERLIVHYMQPHHPFIADKDDMVDLEPDPFGRKGGLTIIDALRRGNITYEAFWENYRSNLELVLEDVALLLKNCNAEKAVITADHGDALGEWGIYDHPAGCLHPVVTDVPWAETTAIDNSTHIPSTVSESDEETDVTKRLRDLGYI